MRNILVVFYILALPCIALATAKPPELGTVIAAQKPVGEASLSKLFLHVYNAQFWSDSGDWKRAPYALVITYDMSFTTDDLADRTGEEMQHVSDLQNAKLQDYTEQLRRIYPAVKTGDRITALQKDAITTVFFHNGKSIGVIKDGNFASSFFGIWLSPKSSEGAMQKQLLSR